MKAFIFPNSQANKLEVLVREQIAEIAPLADDVDNFIDRLNLWLKSSPKYGKIIPEDTYRCTIRNWRMVYVHKYKNNGLVERLMATVVL